MYIFDSSQERFQKICIKLEENPLLTTEYLPKYIINYIALWVDDCGFHHRY
jgi:hypothetical protein